MFRILAICLLLFAFCANKIFGEDSNLVDPSKPRVCYSCLGINCYRTTLVEKNETCTDAMDICITVYQGFGVIARGCYSDIPEEIRHKCEGGDNRECHKCFGQLCNNVGREDFKCIECNSRNNDKCKTNTKDIQPVRCPIPTAPNSYCYVQSNEDGSIERGCSIKVSHQRECFGGKGCALCLPSDGAACNSFNIKNSSRKASLEMSALILALASIAASYYRN